MGSRPERDADDPLRETRRFVALVRARMEATGDNQSEIARQLGLHPSYINKLLLGDRGSGKSAKTGIGANVIRAVMHCWHIDPWYFFDSFDDGERSYVDYPLDKSRIRELATEVARLLADPNFTPTPAHKTTHVRKAPRRI